MLICSNSPQTSPFPSASKLETIYSALHAIDTLIMFRARYLKRRKKRTKIEQEVRRKINQIHNSSHPRPEKFVLRCCFADIDTLGECSRQTYRFNIKFKFLEKLFPSTVYRFGLSWWKANGTASTSRNKNIFPITQLLARSCKKSGKFFQFPA